MEFIPISKSGNHRKTSFTIIIISLYTNTCDILAIFTFQHNYDVTHYITAAK